MNTIIDFVMRFSRWLYRFRKRCGYGIHSPFAFNLVTGVIYEDGAYYSYHRLHRMRREDNVVLREKDDKLLFRLVNNHEPANGIILGDGLGITVDYLKAGRHSVSWHILSCYDAVHSETLLSVLNNLSHVDFVYLDVSQDAAMLAKILMQLLPYVYNHTLIIVRDIRKNSACAKVWHEFLSCPEVRVSMDLHDFGLLYFEKRLNKENYTINYY